MGELKSFNPQKKKSQKSTSLPCRKKGKSFEASASSGTREPTEHDSQAAVFDWIRLNSNSDERLCQYFAVPNQGQRSYGAFKYFEREGFKTGVADIIGLIPWGGFHGHVIEMKRKGNKPTAEQIDFLNRCSLRKYKVNICYSADEAINCIQVYLAGRA